MFHSVSISLHAVRAGVPRAGPILRDNHYGWFDRVKTGHYEFSPKGRRELLDWSGDGQKKAPLGRNGY